MATVKCRCWRCWARRDLSKPPSHYVRLPKCKGCGMPSLFVDRFIGTKRDKRMKKCNCTGYHFTHRRGSKWCHHNPSIEQLHTEEARS